MTSWEYILQDQGFPSVPPRVAYLNIDGFAATASYVQLAKSQGSQTICYIDIGSAEDFRPDYARLAAIANLLGRSYPGFTGERYIDIRRYPEFIAIMDDRIRMCRDKGFNFIEFDLIDTFEDGSSVTGFSLSEADMLAYVTELSRRARGYGLKTVQKNTSGSVSLLLPLFDAILFEECVQSGFCNAAAAYISAGKPALNVEYPENWPAGRFNRTTVCASSASARVTTIITVVDLDRLASDRCP